MKNRLLKTVLSVLVCVAPCPFARAQSSPFASITLTNPTPQTEDVFGGAVAAVGGNVLIGAYQDNTGATAAGAAYLFNLHGTLVTTFTNPAPGEAEIFGVAVSGVGSDKVIIGAPRDDTVWDDGGGAYLFNTNGSLLRSFFPPVIGRGDIWFGNAVSAVGTDKVLIGAYLWEPNFSAIDSGAAYLFRLDGTLETTFTNPAPAHNDWFGWAVAPLGADKVVITKFAKLGAAFVFQTNGTLLTTITNPAATEFEHFGHALAVVGADKILVGAHGNNARATGAGVAYLFNLSGQLITTFTNPAPAANSFFGYAVAGLGPDKVVISALNHANSTGIAYVFDTNRRLLATLTNPTPAAGDGFGFRMAAISTDKLVITSRSDDAGATDAGAAHLFLFPPPLMISKTETNALVLSWPSSTAGFVLQESTTLNPGDWVAASEAVNDDGAMKFIIANPPAGNRFYRLIKP